MADKELDFGSLGISDEMDAPPMDLGSHDALDGASEQDFIASAAADLFGDMSAFTSSVPEPTEDELADTDVCAQVEDTFCQLIKSGQQAKILELTSLDKPSQIPQEARDEFYALYFRATTENPAIALFPRLVAAGIPLWVDENMEVCIKWRSPQETLSFTDKHGASINAAYNNISAITTALITSRKAALHTASQNNMAQVISDFRRNHAAKAVEDGQFEPTDVEHEGSVEDHMLSLDPEGGLRGQEQFVEHPKINFSFIDYGNKQIAEFFHQNHPGMKEEEIIAKLRDDNFPSQRIAEICSIVRYLGVSTDITNRVIGTNRANMEVIKNPFQD